MVTRWCHLECLSGPPGVLGSVSDSDVPAKAQSRDESSMTPVVDENGWGDQLCV